MGGNTHTENHSHTQSHGNTKTIRVDLKKMDGLVDKILLADRARKKLLIQNQKRLTFFALSMGFSVFGIYIYYFADVNMKSNYLSLYRNRGLSNLEYIVLRNHISIRELVNPEIYYLEQKVLDKKFNEYLKKNSDSDKLETFVWA